MNNYDTKYTQYAEDVINDKIVACKYVKLACKRYLSFFGKYDFRIDKVDKVVNFISHLKHTTGKHNGQPFILLPYQSFIIYSIFGFYYKGTDKRVTNYVYIELARKQGKTALASAIALYMLVADGENGAEVEMLANSAKQAKICFSMSSNYLSTIDTKGKYFKRYRDSIKFDKTKSVLQVLSSDSSGNDGWNSSCFVLDECHEQRDSRLWDVMCSSQGMRENPLAMIITTAGFNMFGFCYSYRNTCIEILNGVKEDDTQFTAIYTLDDDDDWTNEENWIKSNPSLDITVSREYLRQQVTKAKNNSTLEVGTRTKNFNQWLSSSDIWINNNIILDSTDNINLKDFQGETAYLGVDLASVSDMTALSIMIPTNDKLLFKTYYYLPQSTLIDNSNAEQYKQWKREGHLIITDGNVTDYDYILRDILKINEYLYIYKVAYDQYNATQWAISATNEGLPLEPFSQALWHFNKPTKEFERLIKSGKVVIDNNPITRWCFSNVTLKFDHNENCLDMNTIVPTTEGLKTIEEIQIGDYVFDEYGKPTKVINTTDINYDRDCYKVTFSNGSEVVCDYTHNWYVNYNTTERKNGKKKTVYKMGYKDTEWLYNNYLRNKSHCVHTIYNKPVEYQEQNYTIEPYTLGQWLGDGSSYNSTFTCEEKDLCMYEHLKEKYTVKYKFDEGKTYQVNVSNGLYTELRKMNLLKNKHIPKEYLFGSVEQRFELLRGLMDTDGTCHKKTGQCTFVQSNKYYNIISDTSKLLNSLGIKHTINKKDNWTTIQFYTDKRVFNLERKYKNQLNYKPHYKDLHNVVMKVEKVDSVPTKCITVENDSHLFLITENYTVTSNCKPVKTQDMQKIDGVISMLEALGTYLETPQYNNIVTAV
jgi:phage terminase large subunit-like protein